VHPRPAPPVGPQMFEGFVSKLSFDSVSSTLSLAYSTFLGGGGFGHDGFGIAVDTAGNAYPSEPPRARLSASAAAARKRYLG
jgi:hypothetical protein